MILNGLLNNTKHRASSSVDLPEPFLPIIKFVGCLSKSIFIGVLPVDKKFCHDIDLKCITLEPLCIVY